MRIRTFCQPDTVIAKQLLDAQSLFNLIGCYEQQQIQLAEVIQFFKVCGISSPPPTTTHPPSQSSDFRPPVPTNSYQVILEREQNFRQHQSEEGLRAGATGPTDEFNQQYRISDGTGQDARYEQ